jgi:DNA-binding protein H-NS
MPIDLRRLNHAQLTDLIARAERRQRELAQERTRAIQQKIVAMVKAEGLDLDDVLAHGKRRTKGTKVPPKYRNPEDPGQTWTGRGRQPLWFAAALKAGKKEAALRIR